LQAQQTMRQGEVSQMQLQKMKSEEAALNNFYDYVAKAGGPTDPIELEQKLIGSRVPHLVDLGLKAQSTRLENDKYQAYKRNLAPTVAAAAVPSAFSENMSQNVTQANAALPSWAPTNKLAPQPSVNTMAAEPTLRDLQAQYSELARFTSPQAKADMDVLKLRIADKMKTQVVGPSASVIRDGVVSYTAPAATPPPRQPNLATDLLIPGPNGTMVPNTALVNVRTTLAREGRPQAQPVAPTITQIVDPTNPNQMITIDARRYTGGGSGSAGVIGVSGKEPSAALRENKLEAGKTLLADEISNLRRSLDVLNTLEAIPSTGRGVLPNLGSSIQASGTGQFFGKVSGTEAQTERDLISSSKLRLVNAIKQATGMSAQQLNSNVELQTMLKSLSDPSQAIETNTRNLDNIETAYVKSAPVSAPRAPQTPVAALSPIDQQALDWANTNKKDPRAAAIHLRLGR